MVGAHLEKVAPADIFRPHGGAVPGIAPASDRTIEAPCRHCHTIDGQIDHVIERWCGNDASPGSNAVGPWARGINHCCEAQSVSQHVCDVKHRAVGLSAYLKQPFRLRIVPTLRGCPVGISDIAPLGDDRSRCLCMNRSQAAGRRYIGPAIDTVARAHDSQWRRADHMADRVQLLR
ncbi:hypothetical protein D3C81_1277490 [compost metagenome]